MIRRSALAAVGLLLVVTSLAGSSVSASADVPQPIYKCQRSNIPGLETVSSPSKCRGGVVHVYSTYDTKRHGIIDMVRLEMLAEKGGTSLSDALRKCRQKVVCGLLLDAVVSIVLEKGVGKAWRFLKSVV